MMMDNKGTYLLGCAVLGMVLFIGVMVGGVGGYMVWQQSASAVVTPINNSIEPEMVNAALPSVGALPPQQQPLVDDSSAAVQAVNRMLPAVVTVVNYSNSSSGSGSGFFISADGYIVTNNHVVEGGQQYRIIYAEGGVADAHLIGTAPEFDVAVIKIDGFVPAVAEWGDSGTLPLGSSVIAIGSALGQYQNTVTGGMLSGFNRELGGLRGLLQTDAAINHGNSGGPLINLEGQVIGINTMVVRGGSSDAVGLGFAIPSNVARNVVKQLIETGEAHLPFLGIQYNPLHPLLAAEYNLPITEGALIEKIVSGTPASQAGLQVGDVIVMVANKAVDDRNQLVSLLFEHVAGETITIEVLRNGERIQAQLVLVEREN